MRSIRLNREGLRTHTTKKHIGQTNKEVARLFEHELPPRCNRTHRDVWTLAKTSVGGATVYD
eukprot:15169004-Heterocapsa_arctica.AAC.1